MTIQFTVVGESAALSSSPPEVPLAPGVDVARLTAGDDSPLFVTLPILRVGAVSRNQYHNSEGQLENLRWDQSGVERIRDEINSKRPEGGFGHIPPEDRDHAFRPGRLRWLGAEIHGDTLFAKAYVPRYAQDAREYLRVSQASGARVGTSIYGMLGEHGVVDMTLESLDLGHPDRLGYPGAAHVPVLTAETRKSSPEEPFMSEDQKNPARPPQAVTIASPTAPDADNASLALDIVAEALSIPRDSDRSPRAVIAGLESLRDRADAWHSLANELSLTDQQPAPAAQTILAEIREHRARAFASDVDALIVAKTKDRDALRPYLREFLVQDGKAVHSSLKDAEQRIDALLASETVKSLQNILRGHTLVISSSPLTESAQRYDHSPEAQLRDARAFGVL